jgi:hypothetical protein
MQKTEILYKSVVSASGGEERGYAYPAILEILNYASNSTFNTVFQYFTLFFLLLP